MNTSGLSLNRSTLEQRKNNLSYIRTLYVLLAIELVLALIWSSFLLWWWDPVGDWIDRWWEFGLAAAIICIVLILATLFVDALKKIPVNWAIYGIFTLFFIYLCGYLSCADHTRLFYYALWLLTAIAIGLAIYANLNNYYMENVVTLLVVMGSAGMVLIGYLAFSDISVFKLLLIYVPIVVFGVYLAYDLRTTVRNTLFETMEEDPVSGAVRVWAETVLVFCRLGELLGRIFHKSYNVRT